MRTFGWGWPAYTVAAVERSTPRQGSVTVRLPSPAHDTATAFDASRGWINEETPAHIRDGACDLMRMRRLITVAT
jgi:hypothetical protein